MGRLVTIKDTELLNVAVTLLDEGNWNYFKRKLVLTYLIAANCLSTKANPSVNDRGL